MDVYSDFAITRSHIVKRDLGRMVRHQLETRWLEMACGTILEDLPVIMTDPKPWMLIRPMCRKCAAIQG